ncbi:sensor histidine kinase [Paenibacillus tyrfis]|uniref:sensor histidine kinase n=1 Tax=Paenibacillus tyrfis TaxID=1501230 RepID=UPI0020A2231C|nr:HAMP domain-containing sensor histidine kinase [Paenibacillus tyrfis]MCP1306817.1 HAMP domain-containing histidine kinase [Paenibacillus tyrfis]
MRLPKRPFSVTLRVKLMLTFVGCLMLSTLTSTLLEWGYLEIQPNDSDNYNSIRRTVNERLDNLDRKWAALSAADSDERTAASLVEQAGEGGKLRAYVTDESGRVLFRSSEAPESKLSLYELLMSAKQANNRQPGAAYTAVLPAHYREQAVYLIVSSKLIPQPGNGYEINEMFKFLLFILLFVLFFYALTWRKMRQIRYINRGLNDIAHGELSVRLATNSRDELGLVAANINSMAEQLARQQEKERRLEKSKMDLITNVSHDLRTPLTSVIGYLNLLMNPAQTNAPERERYLTSAYNKANQLKKLIDDLFEYTRLSGGEAKLERREIDIHHLLEQLVSEFEPIAEQRQIAIECRLPEAPLYVVADAEKLVRALDNLLMNAVKYSVAPGRITVTLAAYPKRAAIEFENEGRPITKAQEELLFERFYKADESRTGDPLPDGAGLGLSIARNIAELHGGRLVFRHEQGRFVFRLELPLNE